MSMRITFRPSWCRNLGSVLLALASVLLINVTGYAVAQDPIPDSGAAVFGNPVIPGDHPDPSIIRVGGNLLDEQHLGRLVTPIPAVSLL